MITALVLLCSICYCLCQIPSDTAQYDSGTYNNNYDDDDETFCLFFDAPVSVCKDPLSERYFDTSNLETERLNETMAFINGTWELKLGLHEHTMVEIVLAKEWNGRFDTILTHQICSLCNEVGNPESDYYPFLIFLPDVCPFDKGIHKIDLMTVDTAKLPINNKNSGRYQATLNLYLDPSGNCQSDKKFIACGKLVFIIEPC